MSKRLGLDDPECMSRNKNAQARGPGTTHASRCYIFFKKKLWGN
jgi:hypothetical protein